ncbi:MAG: hypothetical protein LBI11_03495 [Streptococcaceae bacterium]|jgi:hypothetical protein|nr:hypothetical protein [Streptococcaceae bacterium]
MITKNHTKKVSLIILASLISLFCVLLVLFFAVFRNDTLVYLPNETKIINISNPEKNLFYVEVGKNQVRNIKVKVYDSDGKLLVPQNIYFSENSNSSDGPTGYIYYYTRVSKKMKVYITNQKNSLLFTSVNEWLSQGDRWRQVGGY